MNLINLSIPLSPPNTEKNLSQNNNRVYDYLIVGQGIAGTMVVHHLLQHTDNIFVVDAEENTASFAAAGVINPITGRNYVKSWLIDALLPYALKIYDEIGEKLNIQAYQKLNILRTMDTIKEQNDWEARKLDPEYHAYIATQSDKGNIDVITNAFHEYGEITGSLQVRLKEIILSYRTLLKNQQKYAAKKIDASTCIMQDEYYSIDGILARQVIFCEGINAVNNPLFPELPLISAKGNAVILKADFQLEKNIKDKYFMTRLEDDLYWIGSDYVWYTLDANPDEEAIDKMVNTTKAFFKPAFEVVEKLAGIRPTTKNRRPILGQHPSLKGIYVFNGLGTKGSSLSPYFAKMLVDHIIHNHPLNVEVNTP